VYAYVVWQPPGKPEDKPNPDAKAKDAKAARARLCLLMRLAFTAIVKQAQAKILEEDESPSCAARECPRLCGGGKEEREAAARGASGGADWKDEIAQQVVVCCFPHACPSG